MDAALEDKIDKFCFWSSLRGYHVDGDRFYDINSTLEQLEFFDEVKARPERCLETHTALMAHEQGITGDNFSEYFYVKAKRIEEAERIEEERIAEEQRKQAESIPEYIKLTTVNKFSKVDSKRYHKCYHFKFTKFVNKTPVEVVCRITTDKSYHQRYRLWYQWVDPKTKKTVRHTHDGSKHSYAFVYAPWVLPWQRVRAYWGVPDSDIAVSFAYAMTSRWKGNFKDIVRPGTQKKTVDKP